MNQIEDNTLPSPYVYVPVEVELLNQPGFTVSFDLAFHKRQGFEPGTEFLVEFMKPGKFSLARRTNALVVELMCTHMSFMNGKMQWFLVQHRLSDILKYPTDHVSHILLEGKVEADSDVFLIPGSLVHLVVSAA